MMGDNRGESDDSRFWGPVPRKLDHRRGLRHLLAAQPHRLPLASRARRARRARRPSAAQRPPAVPVRPRARGALRRRRRRGRARLPGRAARRRRGAVRPRGADAVRERPRAGRAQRLQAARRRGARGALPGRPARRRRAVAIVSRCVRGIDSRGLHKTNLAALRDALCGSRGPARLCLTDGFAGRRLRLRAARGRSTATRRVRRDRRRLDPGQGHARPLHAPRRRAAPGLGVRPPRRLLDARAPRGDRSARASRRCTGCRSRARPTSSSRCSSDAASEGALEVVSATSRPRASMTTPIASKRRSRRARAVGDLGR